MAQSYLSITPHVARAIKLIVTDVDGTIISEGDDVSSPVSQIIRSLERSGVMVGFASGRPLTRLDPLALSLKITGPIIAENGAVARMKRDGQLENLGYSRQPALDAFNALKTKFGSRIKEAEDNISRLVDVGFYYPARYSKNLINYIDGDKVQLFDSGYMLHLLQKGVNKGKTLVRILPEIGSGLVSIDAVMVFGDSATDTSLFELFQKSVLILNPKLPERQKQIMRNLARYKSEMPFEDGFIQVCSHIINMRLTLKH